MPPDDWRRVQALQLVGQAVHVQRRPAEAEALYGAAVALAERLAPQEPRRVLAPLTTLAAFLVAERRYAEAHSAYTRALDITQAAYGAADPRTAVSLQALAEIDLIRGDLAAAEARYQKLLGISGTQQRVADDDVLRQLDLAWVLRARDRVGEARLLEESVRQVFAARAKSWEKALRESVRIYRAMIGPTHPLLAVTLRQMAMLFAAESRLAEARRTYESLFALLDGGGLGDSLLMAAALETYGEALQRGGEDAAFRAALGRAAAIRDQHRQRQRDP